MTKTAARYEVRRGAGATMRVTKWQDGSRVTYVVDDDGRTQHCTCPHHGYRGAICKHIRLSNLVESGRLEDGQAYMWNGESWEVAAPQRQLRHSLVSA